MFFWSDRRFPMFFVQMPNCFFLTVFLLRRERRFPTVFFPDLHLPACFPQHSLLFAPYVFARFDPLYFFHFCP